MIIDYKDLLNKYMKKKINNKLNNKDAKILKKLHGWYIHEVNNGGI